MRQLKKDEDLDAVIKDEVAGYWWRIRYFCIFFPVMDYLKK